MATLEVMILFFFRFYYDRAARVIKIEHFDEIDIEKSPKTPKSSKKFISNSKYLQKGLKN
jgi:hypothetical protein